jgi:Cdc6-like AAA superfamily ATPase
MRSFDSEFGSHVKKLDTLGMEIKESVMVLSAKTQQDEVRENSLFRSLLLSKLDKNEEARRKLAVKLSILDKCSTYDFESSWRQMRKKGNSSWIFDTPEYISWRDIPCVGGNRTLLCLGKLGSGKTVLAANVVQDLITCFPQEKVFAYFFCRYDVAESLNARTILGSLARQLLESTDMANSYDFFAQSTQKHPHALSLDGIFSLLNYIIWENARVKHVFLLVDGLDNCEDTEKKLAIQHLKTLAKNGIVRLFLTTRSELESTAVLVEKSFPQQTKVHMLDQTNEINAYIDGELDRRLESGALCLTNPEIIVEIQATLKANAHGM